MFDRCNRSLDGAVKLSTVRSGQSIIILISQPFSGPMSACLPRGLSFLRPQSRKFKILYEYSTDVPSILCSNARLLLICRDDHFPVQLILRWSSTIFKSSQILIRRPRQTLTGALSDLTVQSKYQQHTQSLNSHSIIGLIRSTIQPSIMYTSTAISRSVRSQSSK